MQIRLLLMIVLFGWSCTALSPLKIDLSGKTSGFVDGQGRAFEFRGVNWFGFGNKQTMVDGLWIGGSSTASDFFSIVYRLKLLGFNSVRLPFTFNDLEMKPMEKRISCRIDGPGHIINSTLPIGVRAPLGRKPPFFVGRLPKAKCNEGLDNTSTKKRFLQVIKTLIDNDIYVVLDYHPMGFEPYAWQENGAVVARKWKELVAWLIREAGPSWHRDMKGRLLIDIMNEPDSMKLGWKDTADLYIKTMDALWPILGKDGSLFMVEGTGQVAYGLNWGDGFITDPVAIRKTGIDDAGWFFKRVVAKHYVGNVIVSPHMYGPSIMLSDRASFGPELRDRMWKSYLYLWKDGFAGKRFPIVLGEFGSMFKDPRDLKHLRDLSLFFVTPPRKDHGKHWMWWSWNHNSGDTGGLVKADWLELEWRKLDYLIKDWGLRPWWKK